MNDIIIIAILIIAAGLALRSCAFRKKRGCGSCGGNCGDCGGACNSCAGGGHCHGKADEQERKDD